MKFTEKAIKFAEKQLLLSSARHAAIRFAIRGGGCSGFEYIWKVEHRSEEQFDDICYLFRGDYDIVEFRVDGKTWKLTQNLTIDISQDLTNRGFIVINPDATDTCGCGKSFSIV
jgi:iron-sulfur cluster assembly protein